MTANAAVPACATWRAMHVDRSFPWSIELLACAPQELMRFDADGVTTAPRNMPELIPSVMTELMTKWRVTCSPAGIKRPTAIQKRYWNVPTFEAKKGDRA